MLKNVAQELQWTLLSNVLTESVLSLTFIQRLQAHMESEPAEIETNFTYKVYIPIPCMFIY